MVLKYLTIIINEYISKSDKFLIITKKLFKKKLVKSINYVILVY